MAIKPLTNSDRISIVWPGDPAIDADAVGEDGEVLLDKYSKQCLTKPDSWRGMLKFKAGQQPTEFVIGVIPPQEMARIEDEARREMGDDPVFFSAQLQWESFCLALRDITNGPAERRNVNGVWKEELPKRRNSDLIDGAWLEATFTRGLRKVASHVGMVAWFWNNLSEADVKN